MAPLTLRPVREADLSYFEQWGRSRDDDPFNWTGFRTQHRLRAAFAENGLLSTDDGTLLVVDADGQVVGDVGWHAEDYYGPRSKAYNIGARLTPERRGRGLGGPAQRLLADYLFAIYPANRVEAFTDVDNVPEQRALEKGGFTREGVLRGAQWRDGGWHDLVSYSRLRRD